MSLDSTSLRTITSTSVGTTSSTDQPYSEIAATASGVVLAGEQLAAIDAQGHEQRLSAFAGTTGLLSVAAVGSDLLLVPGDANPRIVRVDATGTQVATLALDSDTGSVTAIGPHVVWATGVPGETGKLAAIRIQG